jgi:uncharacterized protein (DUF1697 family)
MRYVALLRGIMPTNPNMKGEKLRDAFESLGFQNVHTIIASGNVIFDSPSTDGGALEKKVEKELSKRLGFTRTTIIRAEDEMRALVRKDPFKGVRDEKPNYLIVTFFKDRTKELCTVLDLGGERAPQFMTDIEKKYGKEITTRTWKTVGRILKKFDETAR